MSDFLVEAMQIEDLAEVLDVEGGGGAAWTRQQFVEELQAVHGFQFVARAARSQRVMAFACGRLCGSEAEILKLAVALPWRRRGMGSGLLLHVLAHCRQEGVADCFLEVRASNVAARVLYEKYGFTEAGLRRSYYVSPREDAVLMRMRLTR
ncbi:MAG: ribosomal-protein-alanine N-acetyltransferase [Deltaproteobacteria bacterium RIFOXYD12_FULL_57_12]|nr:MAG: ribosomal-protein-alanine N-acetyltransferase [Deltaproteobacteria bacterium RIFOXYD12_FULL_57_12]